MDQHNVRQLSRLKLLNSSEQRARTKIQRKELLKVLVKCKCQRLFPVTMIASLIPADNYWIFIIPRRRMEIRMEMKFWIEVIERAIKISVMLAVEKGLRCVLIAALHESWIMMASIGSSPAFRFFSFLEKI